MWFGGFDTSQPPDFDAVVKHEFGHALGFEHEHQRPEDACPFRWEDDPGYPHVPEPDGRFLPKGNKYPGVYTVLGGAPNYWSRPKVDQNVRPIQESSSAFNMSSYDRLSIMNYHFDSWMYVQGAKAPCYVGAENMDLSAMDRDGAAKSYPAASAGKPLVLLPCRVCRNLRH
jgi:hypothetical protein